MRDGELASASDGSAVRQRPAERITYDWRTAAAWWVRHEFGALADGLIRIVDHRQLGRDEAWVAMEAAGRHVVVGLRHERVGDACSEALAADDGWYRLLYLCVTGEAPQPQRSDNPH
jgi:hypothetical protein